LASNWQRLSEHFDTLFTTEYSIDALKQTILQLAVTGKLVKQDPTDEPASELLKRIAKEKEALVKAGKIKKQKPLPAITDDEKPFELPYGWEWCRLGELAEFQKGYAFKSENYLDCGVMITKIQNLTDNNIQNSVYIAPETASEFDQYLLYEGDIVMTTVGSWFSAPLSAVGRTFIINKLFDNSLLNQNAVRLRTWKGINSRFLFANLGSQSFKNHLYNDAQGTANQASITQDSIKKFLLCIPPENENGRIITKLDELLNICNSLLKAIKIAKQSQSIFSETLVQQVV
jgi:type I restriction enzyme S subunit